MTSVAYKQLKGNKSIAPRAVVFLSILADVLSAALAVEDTQIA